MKRGRLIVGGVAALVLAGAVVFYFTSVPGILAGNYRDSARPEHRKVATAMRRVYATFVQGTFSERAKESKRAKTSAQYIRATHRVARRRRQVLRPARTAV